MTSFVNRTGATGLAGLNQFNTAPVPVPDFRGINKTKKGSNVKVTKKIPAPKNLESLYGLMGYTRPEQLPKTIIPKVQPITNRNTSLEAVMANALRAGTGGGTDG